MCVGEATQPANLITVLSGSIGPSWRYTDTSVLSVKVSGVQGGLLFFVV